MTAFLTKHATDAVFCGNLDRVSHGILHSSAGAKELGQKVLLSLSYDEVSLQWRNSHAIIHVTDHAVHFDTLSIYAGDMLVMTSDIPQVSLLPRDSISFEVGAIVITTTDNRMPQRITPIIEEEPELSAEWLKE